MLERRGGFAVRTIVVPADTDLAGDIFGRWLMWQTDLANGNVAALRARGRRATVAVDDMSFIRPVHVGDDVSLYAQVVHVGKSSISVAVEAGRRRRENHEIAQGNS